VVLLVVNNMTLGYVKALQNGLYDGRFQSVDFLDVDYAAIARAFGCRGERIADPARIGPAVAQAMNENAVTVLDVLVTRDPGRMLPGIDSRAVKAT
jgi:acetolactate synthase-1/2/3 large subunit